MFELPQVLGRDQAGHGLGVPGQDDPLVSVGDPADEVGELVPGLGHWDLTGHEARLCTFLAFLK